MANKSNLDLGGINSWGDLFLWFKSELMNQIKVSSLAFFDSYYQDYNSNKGFGIATVKPFPLQEDETEYTVNAYFFSDMSFTKGEKVFVAFTDYNFISNLNYEVPKEMTSSNTHQNYFAVILPLGTSGGTTAGVSSFGGQTGDITLGSNLSMNSKQLNVTLPTINNSTITINQGGTTKGSFTLNQSGDQTISLDGGSSNELYQHDIKIEFNYDSESTGGYLYNTHIRIINSAQTAYTNMAQVEAAVSVGTVIAYGNLEVDEDYLGGLAWINYGDLGSEKEILRQTITSGTLDCEECQLVEGQTSSTCHFVSDTVTTL